MKPFMPSSDFLESRNEFLLWEKDIRLRNMLLLCHLPTTIFFFFSIFSPKSYGLSGKMCSNKVKITSKNNFLGQRSIQKREQKKKYTWFNWIRYVWQAFIFRKNKVSKPLRGKVLYINLFDVHWDSCNMNVIVVDCVCKIMFDGIYGILRTLRTILFISFHWWMNQRLLFQ